MQLKNIEASRLEYFDRQKVMFDRVRTELVDRYLGEFRLSSVLSDNLNL